MSTSKWRLLHPIPTLLGLSALYEAIYLAYIPNARGGLGADYSFFLPNLLAGYYWHLQNGWFALPWFTPSQCGGVPFYADPQVPFLSAPQFLAFVMPPLEAVQASVMLFAALRFLGAFTLARATSALREHPVPRKNYPFPANLPPGSVTAKNRRVGCSAAHQPRQPQAASGTAELTALRDLPPPRPGETPDVAPG